MDRNAATVARRLADVFLLTWLGLLVCYGRTIVNLHPDNRVESQFVICGLALLPAVLIRLSVERLIRRPVKWQPVTPEEARRKRLYGNDGWGLMPFVAAVLVALAHILLPIRVSNEGWQTAALFTFSGLLTAATLLMIRAARRHQPYAPLMALGIVSVALLFNLAEANWWAMQTPIGARTSLDSKSVGFAVMALSTAVLNSVPLMALMSYLDRSRRINLTFLKMVPR